MAKSIRNLSTIMRVGLDRSIENQAALMHHRARELLAGQRTAALNALRGHLAEIGLTRRRARTMPMA
ncbi:MAG TPA: hypothetical protein VFE60_01770 [Roseiarcus sp.]|nr:hypothetical protein [Roseiarcus sp.]